MTTPSHAARVAQDSTAFRILARVGYVVLGVLHLLIGLIAISVATGGGGEADQGGALEQIQRAPVGAFLLWVIVVGMVALGIWQIAETLIERDPDAKKKWAHRVKFIGTAIAYLSIAATAFTFALGGASHSSSAPQSMSARLMSNPAGIVLLVLIGLIVVGIGVAFVVRGIGRAFEKHLSLPGGAAKKGIVTFGVVGYVAKGIAVGVAGVLFVVAALTHDPAAAGGLDAALHSLAALPYGPIILWIVGAGLVLYGLFCFARARYSRM